MSTIADEIREFWGTEKLQRWSEEAVNNALLPQSSKTFLTTVGLPQNKRWTLQFNPSLGLTNLPDRPNYRVIGHDYHVPVCLDETRSGAVIAVEGSGSTGERFVNSNVEALGRFLVCYEDYCRLAEGLPEELIMEIVNSITKRMEGIDFPALQNPESYWPIIIQQIRNGLL